MTDPKFNNDDNPYIKFKLYHYDNYESKTSPQDKREIPLVPCENEYVDDVLKDIWYPGQYYCPGYTEGDYLYSNYYKSVSAWMRLVIHLCNPEERAAQGKTCASRYEIDEYLYSNIINLKI